jgi:hypothetical protein
VLAAREIVLMRETLKLVVGRRVALWIAIGMVLAFALSWVELLYGFLFAHILCLLRFSAAARGRRDRGHRV